jgi:superfamily II DNA or RNA helicase
MLRLHLPPNLVAAIARDAVPIRVEFAPEAIASPETLPVLALLQRWCGSGQPPAFLQLTRTQLRELAAAAGHQPLFLDDGRLTAWRHAELLRESDPPRLRSPAAVRASPASGQRPARTAAPASTPLTVDGSEHFLALTLPSREHPHYAEALALVRETGFVLEPSNRKWWLRDRHKTLTFLAAHRARLESDFGAQFTPNFQKNTAHLARADVAVAVTAAGGDFEVSLELRAAEAAEALIRAALAAGRSFLETGGRIVLLEPSVLEKLAAVQRALAGDPACGLAPRRRQRLPASRAAEADEILAGLSPAYQAPAAWRERSAALRDLATLAPAPLPASLDRRLRPYQRLGAAWLWHLHRHGLGGVLADEMGLGKTLQALALLTALEDLGPPTGTCSLVVCPASLLENWRRETERFAPRLRGFVHHAERRLANAAEFSAYDLVITSYGTLARDQELFAAGQFRVVIADEAQHIKNRRSQNAAALRTLRARSRFLLTGTPLENSLDDLRALIEFVLPGFIPGVPAGLRGEERAWHDRRLCAQTAPYILRRTKRAVAPDLPERLEQIIWCELAPAQAALYRETRERAERELFDLEAGGASEGRLRLAALTQLLRLRQICCDPRLVVAPPAAESADSGNQTASTDSRPGAPNPAASSHAWAPPCTDSAKLEAFNELLAEAIDDGHRVLVFSQFTSLLALLRTELDAQQLAYCYLDGAMPAHARQLEVDRFQASPDIPLFLLSLKAGGTGLNLTGADTVVHYDPWWNPAVEAQATDRAHRIGQERVVTSYKLIAAGTVEEKVLALQTEKRALLAEVFEASDAASARLSLADLKSLL